MNKNGAGIIKTLLSVVIFISLIGAGLLVYRIHQLRSYKVEYGRLNIEDLIDANLLKVVHDDIDYLIDVPVDGGHYTAIVPFTIVAGFDLDKINIEDDGDTVTVTLPEPEIIAGFDLDKISIEDGDGNTVVTITLSKPETLTVDTSDEFSTKVLRDYKTSNYYYMIRGFKKYAEQTAKRIAVYHHHILQKANKEVEDVLKNMLSDSLAEEGKQLRIITQPTEDEEEPIAVDIVSDYHPVELKVYGNVYGNNESIGVFGRSGYYSIFYGHNIANKKDNKFYLFRVYEMETETLSAEDFVKKYNKNYGILFDPANPGRKIIIKFNNDRALSFFYSFKNWIYRAIVLSSNKDDFGTALPYFLNIVSSVRFLKDYSPKSYGYDIFGMLNYAKWEKCKIKEAKDYIWWFFNLALSSYVWDGSINGYTYDVNPRWGNVYLVEPHSEDKPYVITDKDGLDHLKYSAERFWDDVKEAVNTVVTAIKEIKEEYRDDDVIAVVYNHNSTHSTHRDRFLILFKDVVVYYTPKRFIQSAVIKDIFWKNLSLEGVDALFNKGCYISDMSSGKTVKKAIESKSLCTFLQDFINYGFPAVFKQQ